MAHKCKLSQHISIYCQFVSHLIYGTTQPDPVNIVIFRHASFFCEMATTSSGIEIFLFELNFGIFLMCAPPSKAHISPK